MHEALSSIPKTGTKDGRTEERRKQREGGEGRRERGREEVKSLEMAPWVGELAA